MFEIKRLPMIALSKRLVSTNSTFVSVSNNFGFPGFIKTYSTEEIKNQNLVESILSINKSSQTNPYALFVKSKFKDVAEKNPS